MDIFRSLVDGSDRCTVEIQSCICVCVRGRGKARECDHAFISHAVAYSVWQLERAGARGRPTGIKKALSVGCVSQWAAEPRGAALLIKAGVVCQRRHMMHSTITVGGKTKHKARLLQPLQQICCLTMEARHLTTATPAVVSSVRISLHRVTQPAIIVYTRSAESNTPHNAKRGKRWYL